MSAKLKKLSELTKRGPHRVMVGDLGYTGLPGKVYTPEKGEGLPAIAFGHDWLKKVGDYNATLRHLASWGIVVAAPDTETGFRTDHAGFAADLDTATQILAGVRLGNGNVTVSPKKIGVAGHGMGGGAAVLTAVDNQLVKAVAAVYPANTAPSAIQAARNVFEPGMVFGPGKNSNSLFDPGNPAKLAYNWAGEVVYRRIDKGSQSSFAEAGFAQRIIGMANPNSRVQGYVRALLTGYFLHALDGQKKYSEFGEPDAAGAKVTSATGEELADLAGLTKDNDAFSFF